MFRNTQISLLILFVYLSHKTLSQYRNFIFIVGNFQLGKSQVFDPWHFASFLSYVCDLFRAFALLLCIHHRSDATKNKNFLDIKYPNDWVVIKTSISSLTSRLGSSTLLLSVNWLSFWLCILIARALSIRAIGFSSWEMDDQRDDQSGKRVHIKNNNRLWE